MIDDIPTLPMWAYDEIWASLRYWARQKAADPKAFQFNQTGRRSTDSYYDFFISGFTFGPRGGVPTFAAVVRHEIDYGSEAERRIASEIEGFYKDGVQVVWDIDVLEERVIRVYRKENREQPTIYHRGEVAEAEPAVPGWTMGVDELFR